MAAQRIIGEEVIVEPGQGLDNRELRYLLGLADGESNEELASVIGVRREELPFIEASIRNKLGAKTKSHMIARAFNFGVLKTRAIAALALVAVVGLTGALYYKQHHMPSGSGATLDYDTMAGGSRGPATLDPRYIDNLNHRHGRS